MLEHSVFGPYEDGTFLIVYPIPGCKVMQPVLECSNESVAHQEAARLNQEQINKEALAEMNFRIQCDRRRFS